MNKTNKGTRWFARFKREAEAMSPHIRFKRIKYGFYRIYWVGDGAAAYITECSENMEQFGHEIEEKNFQLDSKKYFEEYEDNAELIQKIKNFKEGYWDSVDKLKTNVYLFKNNSSHRKAQQAAYKEFVIK